MNKKVLNVVSVFFSVPFFFGDQLIYFHDLGYEVHVICSPSEKLKEYSKIKKFKFSEISILRKIAPLKDLLAVYKVLRYIKSNNIEIVSGHTAKGGLVAMMAAYLARVPKRLYFRHGFYYENNTGVKRFIMKSLDKFTAFLSTQVVCVSPFVYEKSIEFNLNPESKLTLLNIGSCNGVDVNNKFNPLNIKKEIQNDLMNKLQIKSEDFVIGYTGRIVEDKGIVELVDAFVDLSEQNKNLKLLLVGPEEVRNSIPKTTREIIFNNPQIILTGLIETNIEYYYSIMSVLILPTHREGLGTSLLEAASMEKPVITTSHTGSRDAIINDVTGQYITMSSDDIKIKVLNYMNSRALLKLHGKNGRIHMIQNFSQEIIWKEIQTKLYEN